MNNVGPEMESGDHLNPDTKSTGTDGIQLNELAPNAVLSITTTNHTYELTVIDPETGHVRVSGGVFPEDTLAQIAGSSLDSSIKLLGIYLDHCMEFFVQGKRVRTSPIRAIRVSTESERAA
jgi:hypothetical protein